MEVGICFFPVQVASNKSPPLGDLPQWSGIPLLLRNDEVQMQFSPEHGVLGIQKGTMYVRDTVSFVQHI